MSARAARAGGAVGREVAATVRLAGPVVLGHLSMMSMGLVDAAVVGHRSAVDLAAVSLGNALFFTCAVAVSGVVKAVEPTAAQALGARRGDRAAAVFWSGIAFGLLASIPIVIAFRDARWLLALVGADPAVTEAAAGYLAARAPSAPAFMLFIALQSLLHAAGRVRPIVLVAIAANVVNLVADIVLVFGLWGAPELGAAGAGHATVAARWFMVAGLVLAVRHAARSGAAAAAGDVSLLAHCIVPRRPSLVEMGRLLRTGLPLAGQLVAEVSFFSAGSVIVAQFGPLALAGHQITNGLASFAFMVPLGIGVAASVRVGRAVGAGDRAAAERAGRVALALGSIVMAVFGAIFVAVPALLARAFTADAAVIEASVPLIRLAGAFAIFDGAQSVAAGALRGAGDVRAPFVAMLLAFWALGFPLGIALAIGLGWGAVGMWIAYTASLAAIAAVLVRRFLAGRWTARPSLVE